MSASESGDAVRLMTRWYDVRTNAYIEWCYGDGREVARALAAAVGLEAGWRVLEVGCNVGNIAFFLARRFGCGVVGVDASRAAIEVAQIRAQESPPPVPVVFHVADARVTPFDDGEFDAVISKDTFVNIVDRPRLLRELWRILKPGGWLAFTDWVQGNPEPSATYRAWRELKKEEPFEMLSLEGYAALLAATGLAVVSTRDRGEEFRQLIAVRYAEFVAADPAEMQRRFGIANHEYFVRRFGLTRDVILAGDVTWGEVVARKP